MNLYEIAVKAEAAIEAIDDAEQLILKTYGAGCIDCYSHPDALDIARAARTLVIHLSWLKARAVSLELLNDWNSTLDVRPKFAHLVR